MTTNLFGVTLHRFSIQERNCMTAARKPLYCILQATPLDDSGVIYFNLTHPRENSNTFHNSITKTNRFQTPNSWPIIQSEPYIISLKHTLFNNMLHNI